MFINKIGYIFLIILSHAYNLQENNSLVQAVQSVLILPNSYFQFVFAVSNILKHAYLEAQVSAQINLNNSSTQPTNSFDFLMFPSQNTTSQLQYQCYVNAIELGIYNLSNCSINCEVCQQSCILQCFNSNESCCCSNCFENYSIKVIQNVQIALIDNEQKLVIIDNSNMFSWNDPNINSTTQLSVLNISMEYVVEITVNKKYEIMTYTTVGLSIFMILFMLIVCACFKRKLSQVDIQIKQLIQGSNQQDPQNRQQFIKNQ